MAQLAMNGRPNSVIGSISPFYLRNGYEIDPVMEPTSSPVKSSTHPGKLSAERYLKRLKDAQAFAQAAMAAAEQRNESNANRYPTTDRKV